MKIGIFSECYSPTINGVVISIETFRKQLEKKGHEFYIFAPGCRHFKDANPNVFRSPSISIPGRSFYPVALPFLASSLYAKAASLNLDLIHSQHIFSMGRLGLKIARKLDIPIIHTYHTLLTEYTYYVPLLANFAKKFVINMSVDYCNRCDQIVTPSKPMRKVLLAYGIKTPIEVIPTGIPLEKFARLDNRPLKTKWDIPERQKILLFVGRLAKEKNIHFLFDAFLKIIKEYPDVHLIMVGGGPEENNLKEQVKTLDLFKNITFTGYLPKEEVEKIFASADIFVFPSKTETQGIVVAEAMAAGTVPVAVDKMGPTDVISDKIDGFLVPENIDEFADKILRLLKDDNLRAVMSQKAIEKAKNFSDERTAEHLENLYVKVKNSYFAYLPFTNEVSEG